MLYSNGRRRWATRRRQLLEVYINGVMDATESIRPTPHSNPSTSIKNKMKVFAVLASFAAACLAQNVVISAPPGNSTIFPGEWITVEVDKPVGGCFCRERCFADRRSCVGRFVAFTGGSLGPVYGPLPRHWLYQP